jgi:hypothetical protein
MAIETRMIMLTRRHALMLGAAAFTAVAAPAARAQMRFYPEDFGARGDGVADDAQAINACDLAASAANAAVVFRNLYRVRAQLLMSADWHFEGGEIIRDWTGRHNAGQKDASATVKGRNNDAFANFYADPGPYRPTGVLYGLSITGDGTIRMSQATRAYYDTHRGSHATVLYMLCDDFHIGADLKFALGGNDWCICYGGNGFNGDGFTIFSQTGLAFLYEDGFHVIFGRNGTLTRPNIESGDDSIAFANNLNQGISSWIVTSPTVFSHRAFGIKIASQRLGTTDGYGPITEALEDIRIVNPRWSSPNGRRSRNGYVRFDASGGSRTGIIRRCSVIGGNFEGAIHGLPANMSSGVAAISMAGPVEDCSIEARVRHASLWVALMTPGSDGRGPVRSGFDLDSPDRPNWARGKGVSAVAVRGARDYWVKGTIAEAE